MRQEADSEMEETLGNKTTFMRQAVRQEAGSEKAETAGNKTTFMRQPVLEDGAMWEGHHRCETYCLIVGGPGIRTAFAIDVETGSCTMSTIS